MLCSVRTFEALILLRTETSLLRPASPENESCSRFEIWFWTPSALARIEPMVAMAFSFAPSASSTDAYSDCTRPSSGPSIPESSNGSYLDSWAVAFWYPVLMVGNRPELMPLTHDPVLPKVFGEVTFLHCENSAR